MYFGTLSRASGQGGELPSTHASVQPKIFPNQQNAIPTKSSIIAARASDLWTSAATTPEQMSSATVHLKRRCDGAGYEPTDLIFRRKLKRKNSGEDDLLKALGFKP